MKKSVNIRYITTTGILIAVATILMYLEFSVPFVPSFLKFDFSDLPALIASFAYGPIAGAVVCLAKNILHLPVTNTSGVGELSNFILGCCYVIPAGIIYKKLKSKKAAFIGALVGTFTMTVISLFSNYYIVYPFYAKLGFTKEIVLSLYRVILPSIENLWQALLIFNVPFTMIKGIIVTFITMLIYKKLSPILHGKKFDR